MIITIELPPRRLCPTTMAWLFQYGTARYLRDGKGKFRDVAVVQIETYELPTVST